VSEYLVSWIERSDPAGDVWSFAPAFKVEVGGAVVGRWFALMSDLVHLNARAERRRSSDETEAERLLQDAFTRWAMRRLEAALLEGELPPSDHLRVSEITDVVALAGAKTCVYQQRLGRDLYCTCAGPNDETVTVTIGGRRAAPTSTPTCRACSLQSTDWLCSHFTHPEVSGVKTMGGYFRQVAGVLCELGHNSLALSQPEGCRPGGRDGACQPF
jgi:hypothetical protein